MAVRKSVVVDSVLVKSLRLAFHNLAELGVVLVRRQKTFIKNVALKLLVARVACPQKTLLNRGNLLVAKTVSSYAA